LIIPLPLTLQAINCANVSESGTGGCIENPLGSESIALETLYGRLLFFGVLFLTGVVALIMFV